MRVRGVSECLTVCAVSFSVLSLSLFVSVSFVGLPLCRFFCSFGAFFFVLCCSPLSCVSARTIFCVLTPSLLPPTNILPITTASNNRRRSSSRRRRKGLSKMTSYRSILAVGIAAACTPLGGVDAVFTSSSSSSSSSIFGTSFTGGLVKIDGSTGKLTPEGPDHRDELEGKKALRISRGRIVAFDADTCVYENCLRPCRSRTVHYRPEARAVLYPWLQCHVEEAQPLWLEPQRPLHVCRHRTRPLGECLCGV